MNSACARLNAFLFDQLFWDIIDEARKRPVDFVTSPVTVQQRAIDAQTVIMPLKVKESSKI